MNSPIYFDNNATTPLDKCVREAMISYLQESFGNPSSNHAFGQQARGLLIKSRDTIAKYLKVRPEEIVFNSGGTEGANMILRGLLQSGGHVVTSDLEHACVYQTISSLGIEVTYLKNLTVEAVANAIQPNTKLIALMAVNNETGEKTDYHSIARVAQKHNIPFFVDGVALLGKEHFTIPDGVSAMTFSGHKFHAPKGIGFAFLHRKLRVSPLLIGGEQEYGKRGGTENLVGIVGLAKAVELLNDVLPNASETMHNLRIRLEAGIIDLIPDVIVNGNNRVVNTSNLSFLGVEGESLLRALDMAHIAVSHGSACSAGALEPSRVLLNMGIPKDIAQSSIRFSLSRLNTVEEVDHCINIVVDTVKRLRNLTR